MDWPGCGEPWPSAGIPFEGQLVVRAADPAAGIFTPPPARDLPILEPARAAVEAPLESIQPILL